MGIVVSFGLRCLATLWWRAKPHDQKVVKATQQVSLAGTQYLAEAKEVLKTAGHRVTEIQAARVSKKPVIDNELKDILLEHMSLLIDYRL